MWRRIRIVLTSHLAASWIAFFIVILCRIPGFVHHSNDPKTWLAVVIGQVFAPIIILGIPWFAYHHYTSVYSVIAVLVYLAVGTPLLLRRWRALSAKRLREQRLEDGQCPQCGYDLRETLERCPECGEVVPKAV
jgi:hypothetical protein